MSVPEHDHPTPALYWKIAVLLAVLTAVEVAIYYIDQELGLGAINALVLVVLALAKFVIVIGFYMHLRYERPLLSRFFGGGFVLAIGLYLIVLAGLGVVAIRGG
jgi:cytochrome c oxidase subunit 4